MNRNLRSSLYVTSFFGLSAYFFGKNDHASMLLLGASIVLLYPVILVGQMTLRNAAKTSFNEQSRIHGFLNKKNTIFQRVLALSLAVVLSLSFLVIANTLTIDHGYVASLLIILAVTYAASRVVTDERLTHLEEFHISPNARIAHIPANSPPVSYDSGFLGLLAAIFLVNLILALVLSARELFVFFTVNIDFGNFIHYASDRSIPREAGNEYSRIFINIYLIMDAFKLASANEVLLAFDLEKQSGDAYFYGFYGLVLFFNLLKLFAFSLPLVFLQRSLIVRAERFFEKPAATNCKRLCLFVKPIGAKLMRKLKKGLASARQKLSQRKRPNRAERQ